MTNHLRTSLGMWLGAMAMTASACSGGGGGSTDAGTGQGGASTGQTSSSAGQGGASTGQTSSSAGPGGTTTGQGGGAPTSWPSPPCGIFVLGTAKAGFTKNQTRNYPFIDGFVLRLFWSDFTSAAGVYNFADVDAALASVVGLGQKLSIEILGEDPSYVTADAVDTWVFHDTNPNHPPGNCTDADGCMLAVPWDAAALAHYQDAVKALAAHKVASPNGMVALADHPSFALLQAGFPGWGRIREQGFAVETWPGYSRPKLIKSVTDAIDIETAAFPHKPIDVGFWDFSDGVAQPAFWTDMNKALLDRYSDATGSRLGYFQENLYHGVSMGVDDYGPKTTYATPLFAAKDQTFVALQMLTSWTNPFTGADKVAGGSPDKAMAWANQTYGTRYFEIYSNDTDTAQNSNPTWLAGINSVHQTLACPP